jgi:hypothetical protein
MHHDPRPRPTSISLRASKPRVALVALALLGGAGAASGAGCSIVNAFDDVKPYDAGVGGASSSSSSSSSSTTASSSSSSSGATTSSSSSSSSTTTASSSSSSSSGAPAPIGIALIAGRVVVNGNKTDAREFAIINAATGAQLTRYSLSVIAATHDPASDLWYLFEASALPPFKGEAVHIHVGTIDPVLGTWTEISGDGGVVGLPNIIDSIDLGVLNNRLVYAAFDPSYDGGAIAPIGLAVVDTSGQAALTPAFAPDGFVTSLPSFFGFLANPNPSTKGGLVNLVTQNCAADAGAPAGLCILNRLLLTIPADTTPPNVATATIDTGIVVAKAGNGIGESWGTQGSPEYDLVAVPPLTADGGTANIDRFIYSGSALDSTIPFPVTPAGAQYSGLALSDCLQTVLVSDRGNKLLYAVPLAGAGTTSKVVFTDPPTVLYFEPISQSVLVPFQPANATYHLNAVTLGGTATAPTLTPNTGFAPPADLAVDAVAIRHPSAGMVTCP